MRAGNPSAAVVTSNTGGNSRGNKCHCREEEIIEDDRINCGLSKCDSTKDPSLLSRSILLMVRIWFSFTRDCLRRNDISENEKLQLTGKSF